MTANRKRLPSSDQTDKGVKWQRRYSMRIDIEQELNEVVVTLGGMRVDQIVGKNPPFRNADYVFPNEPCVVELKCLEKDQMPEFPDKLAELIHDWIRKGVIPPLPPGRSIVETKDLPIDCQRQAAKIYRKPLLDVLDNANQQLRATKKHLDMLDSPGLLLLANNDNKLLELDPLLYSLASALKADQTGKRRDTSINQIVYFTANLPMVGPNPNMDYHVWLPLRIDQNDDRLILFTEQLGKAWIAHYGRLVGNSGGILNLSSEGLKTIRLRRPWD